MPSPEVLEEEPPPASAPEVPEKDLIKLLWELDVPNPHIKLGREDGPLSKLAKHAETVARVLGSGASLPLPFGAGAVLAVAAALFTQLGKLGRADGAAMQLTINKALILEIFSGLNAKGGFSSPANSAYWEATAGKLHMFMIKKVCALSAHVHITLASSSTVVVGGGALVTIISRTQVLYV